MSDYYNVEGESIDLETWAQLQGLEEYRRIALTKVGNQLVSTIWLGVNFRFSDGPPLIFETIVLPECNYCVRTPTAEAALAAHDQAVKFVQEQEDDMAKQEKAIVCTCVVRKDGTVDSNRCSMHGHGS